MSLTASDVNRRVSAWLRHVRAGRLISQHGDKVNAWCYFHGTHTADWHMICSAQNSAAEVIPSTGRRWRDACAATYRVVDGRLVEVWSVWDWMSLVDQLGVLKIGVEGPSIA